MADTPITERQKFWRDHVLAAAAFNGTIVECAKANHLKTKDIYQWKTSLTRRGLLGVDGQEKTKPADFVVLAPGPIKPAKAEQSVKLRLTFRCGTRLEFFSNDDSSVSHR